MDAATNHQNNCGSYHNLDCNSNLSAMEYDSKCIRCVKIKHVIGLRRKTTKNGCSLQEQASAAAIAEKIAVLYKLTRGEVMDREYAQEAITVRNDQSRRKSSRGKRDRYTDKEVFI